MNGIKGIKPAGQQCNRFLDSVITMIKYKKSTIYHSIYIKGLPDGTVSYLIVSTDNVLNATNNETSSPELIRVFEEAFEINFQEGSALNYLNFRISSLLLVSFLIRMILFCN